MSPQRIQLKRTKGWRLPEGAVVVSRPSKWGNPFRLNDLTHGLVHYQTDDPTNWDYECRISGPGNFHPWFGPEGTVIPFYVRWATRAEVVELFRRTLLDPTEGMRHGYPSRKGHFAKVTPDEIRADLAGHDLACWCALDAPCHADVLLEIANSAVGSVQEQASTEPEAQQ